METWRLLLLSIIGYSGINSILAQPEVISSDCLDIQGEGVKLELFIENIVFYKLKETDSITVFLSPFFYDIA